MFADCFEEVNDTGVDDAWILGVNAEPSLALSFRSQVSTLALSTLFDSSLRLLQLQCTLVHFSASFYAFIQPPFFRSSSYTIFVYCHLTQQYRPFHLRNL
jgi:hypothetical protein